MERRAARRGHCQTYAPQADPQQTFDPYGDRVQVVGQVAEPQEYEVRWQCVPGRGCRPVRVPVAKTPVVKPLPIPDRKFVPADPPLVEPGHVEPVGKAATEPIPEVVFNPEFIDDSNIPDTDLNPTLPPSLPPSVPAKDAPKFDPVKTPEAPEPIK